MAQLSPLEAAEDHFTKGRYTEASRLFADVLKNPFAPPRDTALSHCRIGIIQSIQENHREARLNLEKAISSGALLRNQGQLCSYALLQIYVLGNANAEARQLLQQMGEPRFSPPYVARIYALGAEIGQRLRDSQLEVIYLRRLASHMETHKIQSVEVSILGSAVTLAEVKRKLGHDQPAKGSRLASNTATSPTASNPAKESQPLKLNEKPDASVSSSELPPITHSGEDRLKEQASPPRGSDQSLQTGERRPLSGLQSVAAMQHIQRGDFEESLQILSAIEERGAGSAFFQELGLSIPADQVSRRLRQLVDDHPKNVRVGVILPVGSTFVRYNNQILKGLSAFANSSATQGVNYTFHVRSVPADHGSAEEATRNLLFDDAVHVIIGPVSGGQTLSVLSLARLFAVPVFSFGPVAYTKELNSDFLVRMGLFSRSQAKALVAHTKRDLQARRVSILAPNDAFGLEMADAFASEAALEGLEVHTRSLYPFDATTFQDSVKETLGSQEKARETEEYRAIVQDMRKRATEARRKFDPSQIKVPAYVPFDALFVPDSLSKARVISSTFAFHEARQVRYLGERQWAESVTGRSHLADQFVNGARVPVATAGSFLPHVRKDLNQSEGSLFLERQAFDSLILIRQAQFRTGGNNGKRLIDSLREPNFTADGTMKYQAVDKKGEPLAAFSLNAYKGGKLIEDLSYAFDEKKP